MGIDIFGVRQWGSEFILTEGGRECDVTMSESGKIG